MSDCSTNAMKPKDKPRICGTCDRWRRVGGRRGYCFDEPIQNGCAPLYLYSDVACEEYVLPPLTLEQRYQQLEQVARDMLEKIRTLSALCIDGYDFQIKLEAIEDDTRPFIERLKELGVIDD